MRDHPFGAQQAYHPVLDEIPQSGRLLHHLADLRPSLVYEAGDSREAGVVEVVALAFHEFPSVEI